MRLLRWLAVLGFAATIPLQAAGPAVTDYLPAGTKVVLGLRVRPLAETLAAQGFTKDIKTQTSGFLKGTPFEKFDPIESVDELVIATTGQGQNPPAMIWIAGSHSFESLFSGAKSSQGVPLLEDPKSKQVVALLNETTMIAGDPTLVHAALAPHSAQSAAVHDLAARMEPMRSKYEFWALGEVPQGAATSDAPEELQAIDHFSFGVTLSHGLDAAAEIRVRTEKDAEKFTQTLQMLQAMVKMQPAASSTKFDLQANGRVFKLSLSIPEAEWKKALESQKANLQSALVSRLTGATTESARPAPPKYAPPKSGKSEVKSDAEGNTVVVTLTGKK